MKNLRTLLALVSLAFLTIPTAQAGNVTLGYTSGSADVSDTTIFDDPVGANIHIGYKSGFLFGFELGLFGMVDDNATIDTADDVSIGGRSLTMTFSLPLGFITIFGRGGVADWAVYQDEVKQYSGHSPTYGGGLDFHFNENWAVRVERQVYTDIGPTDTEISHNRLGVAYTFD